MPTNDDFDTGGVIAIEAVATLVELDRLWVRVYVPEPELGINDVLIKVLRTGIVPRDRLDTVIRIEGARGFDYRWRRTVR